MSSEFFAKLPAKLAKDGHLIKIGSGLPVYIYLMIIADWKTKIARVKVATICKNVGKGDRTVRGWLKDLEKGGYIAARASDHHLKITVLDLPEGITDRQKTADPDRQKITGRPAENCRPPYMKVLRESLPTSFGDENQKRKHPNPITNRFFYFALKTFERFNGYPLHCDKTDVEKLDSYFNQRDTPRDHFKMVRVAWLLYQADTDNNYLKTVPRTINLFLKQNTLNDFFRKAAALLKKTQERRMRNNKAPNTPTELMAAQLKDFPEGPDALGQAYWKLCLDHIKETVYPVNFEKYFSGVFCLGFSEDEIILSSPNKFNKNLLEQNYTSHIWRAMYNVDRSRRKVIFKVIPEQPEPQPTQTKGVKNLLASQ